jgi:exosome complex component RRP40
MEFQNATKRDRPNYPEGTLVYCRVLKADKYAKPMLSCISLTHNKAWNSGEAFFGKLEGGFVKEFPIRFCRNLLTNGGSTILERLGEKLKYEINIGYNGRIWVNGERIVDTIFIFNALERIVEIGDTQENIDFIMNKLFQ